VGRRLAFELVQHGRVDLDDFGTRALRLHIRPDPRRWRRVQRCAEQTTEVGRTGATPGAGPPGRRCAVDREGLAPVVKIGFDGYAEQRLRERA
jgi:hypothetical protein